MNNCRRLTRADRARIARAINGVSANEIPDNIIGFGRAPFPLRFGKDPRDVAPQFPRLNVVAPLVGSPAWMEQYETRLERFVRKVEPILLVMALVIALILLAQVIGLAQMLGV